MELTNFEAYKQAEETLKKAGVSFSKSEIYGILIKINGFKNYTDLVVHMDENLANPEYFLEIVNDLASNIPPQYALKSAPFLNYDFYVDKRVLIPRPETEELVADLVNFIFNNYKIEPQTIADICTGSGCIAISLKNYFPNSKVYGSDVSKDALDVAKMNADKYKTDVTFVESDKLKYFIDNKIKFDVLVSNPPYVEKMEDIDDNVKNFEPLNAIYVKDGTEFYEDYFKHHKEIMNDNFLMAFEINYDQEEKLTFLIQKYFSEDTNFFFRNDSFGKTRYLYIFK